MRLLRLLVALFVLSLSAPATAEPDINYILTKLELAGDVSKSRISFALEGGVLGDKPVAVLLFGPPERVRLENVTENGKPALVGFYLGSYYVVTASKRFTIKGTLALDESLAVEIAGPVNTIEASFTSGRLAEGSPLVAVTNRTVHFDTGLAAKSPLGPTTFHLARAIRVRSDTTFEYRLAPSSADAVVRFPLRYGEKVRTVEGAIGWTVEGAELVLPPIGRHATLTITGSMPSLPKQLAPDPGAVQEWWLLESDGEHRIHATGTAAQYATVASPIRRVEDASQLFLAKPGDTLSLEVHELVPVDALTAIVRDHTKTAVLTPRGDWVFDEVLSYENSGVDFLPVAPPGQPIFESSNGHARRLMHDEVDPGKLTILLRKGSHELRVQSIGELRVAPLFGALAVPTLQHQLTESRSVAWVGLPANVHPIVALGGDHPAWLLDRAHFVAIGVALLVAWIAMSRVRDKLLLAVVLSGTWFVHRPTFVAILAILVLFATLRFLSQNLRGIALFVGRAMAVPLAVAAVVFLSDRATSPRTLVDEPPAERNEPAPQSSYESQVHPDGSIPLVAKGVAGVSGVRARPVALPRPKADRWVKVSRELVTPDRPFVPRVVYVTTLARLLLAVPWLLAFGLLAWSHRAAIAARLAALRALFAPKPEPEVEAAAE